MSENPYAYERDEWRAGLRDTSEMERASGCRHDYRPNQRGGGTCRWCSDTIQEEP